MACEYCYGTFGHDSKCPNAQPNEVSHYCSICKEGIYNGEEYIVNENGNYAHWECVDYGRDLVRWLGFEIRTMESDCY